MRGDQPPPKTSGSTNLNSVSGVGNGDANLDPGESVVCTGLYEVTQADLDYVGSIMIDADLMQAAPLPAAEPALPPAGIAGTSPGNPSRSAPAGAAWPGASLAWPKLNPFTSANEPPPGIGGGTIDPFKRARGGATP